MLMIGNIVSDKDRVLEALSAMVDEIAIIDGDITSYLFGSYINKNGEQFNSSSGDIDLAHVLLNNMNCHERSNLIFSLSTVFDNLETSLLRALHRNDASKPIASHCILTPLEKSYDIHKDMKKDLLSGNRFALLPVSEVKSLELVALASARDAIFFEENFEAVQAIAFTQSVRNKYLSFTPNGRRGLNPVGMDNSKDPLPKEFMRIAAMLIWSQGSKQEIIDRENTQKGLDFISTVLLPKYSKEHEVYGKLADVLSVRRGARGKSQNLLPEHQVLIAEMLFDFAAEKLKPTFKMGLKAFVSGLNDKTQKRFDPAA